MRALLFGAVALGAVGLLSPASRAQDLQRCYVFDETCIRENAARQRAYKDAPQPMPAIGV